MRNLRASWRRLCLPLLSTVLLTVGAGVLLGAVRADADGVGTLQVHGTFSTNFSSVECPAGTPATTDCFPNTNTGGEVPGLGKVTTDYTLVFDDFGSACGHAHAQIPLIVTGKGEIDLATRTTGCIVGASSMFPPGEATVSGGSGRYAGASGSGVLDYRIREATAGAGTINLTWTGTLNVAGLAFDTTPPKITGASSKTAKTRAAAGARVRYSVSATDATDGPVPVACLPRPGRIFRVGRTTVTCTAVDGSANTATARFIITVERTHR
jgi:HYR domain